MVEAFLSAVKRKFGERLRARSANGLIACILVECNALQLIALRLASSERVIELTSARNAN
ncbi:MAG: hypothetical protein ACP5RJ_09060 [Conexivisphaera sp.]